MTKYLIEEIQRCRKDPAEFLKYITDQAGFAEEIDDIFNGPITESWVSIVENMNVFIGCTILWKCIYEPDYSAVIFSKNGYLIMDAIRVIYDRIPSFLTLQCTIMNKSHMQFGNGSSIRRISHPSGACGLSCNFLSVVNKEDFSEKVMEEFRQSIYPVISSRRDGKIAYIKGNV